MQTGKKIGIKLGSQLLTDGNGMIHEDLILSVCQQVAMLKQAGNDVFIVTSGAIQSDSSAKRSDKLRAAVGQPGLMFRYKTFFKAFNLKPAQFLPTYYDLNKDHSDHIETIREGFADKEIVPVINYNDPSDDKEIEAMHKFADNDNLFCLLCLKLKVDYAIICFNEQGLYYNGELTHEVCASERENLLAQMGQGNAQGHGKGSKGPQTKIKVLCDLAENDIAAYLIPGKEKDCILKALEPDRKIGTFFSKI